MARIPRSPRLALRAPLQRGSDEMKGPASSLRGLCHTWRADLRLILICDRVWIHSKRQSLSENCRPSDRRQEGRARGWMRRGSKRRSKPCQLHCGHEGTKGTTTCIRLASRRYEARLRRYVMGHGLETSMRDDERDRCSISGDGGRGVNLLGRLRDLNSAPRKKARALGGPDLASARSPNARSAAASGRSATQTKPISDHALAVVVRARGRGEEKLRSVHGCRNATQAKPRC